ncbi:MAG: hypothetical protein ACKVQU_13385 [Burkholderiales bacterium]
MALVALVLVCGEAVSQSSIQYRIRGNRSEGVKGLPVTGYAIELMSFRATYEEPLPSGTKPPQYRLRFYLENADQVPYLAIRTYDNFRFYWLDKVSPAVPWKQGYGNVFEWPTRDVIAHLPTPPLSLYDLGVTVRIGDENPRSKERLAPVVLYHSKPPSLINGYEFQFNINATVALENSIVRVSDGAPVTPGPDPRIERSWSSNVPFRVNWDATNALPGVYRLRVNARITHNNEKLAPQNVEFFHQPRVN